MRVFKVLGIVVATLAALLVVIFTASLLWSMANSFFGFNFGFQSYKAGVGYGRSSDLTPITLNVSSDDIQYRINYLRAAGLDRATIRGGSFSQAKLGYTWPDLIPMGTAPERRLGRRVVLGGFEFSRPQSFHIELTSRHFIGKGYRNYACGEANRGTVLDTKYYDLIAIDTLNGRGRGNGRRNIDGTYGNLRTLMPAPMGEADLFFYLTENPQDIVDISCGRAPFCRANMGWQGVKISVIFDAWDLPNWKLYTSKALRILDEALQDEITFKNDPWAGVQKNECPILDRLVQ